MSCCRFLALVLAVLASASLGAPAAYAEEEIRVEIRDGLEMQQLLETVSTAAELPLVWDPSDKQIRGRRVIGGINLKGPKKEIFQQLQALLTFHELVIVPVGPKGFEILLVMDARRTTSILRIKAKWVELTDANVDLIGHLDGVYVTTSVQVKHLRELRNVRTALSRVITGQNIGSVTEVPDAGVFVITDFAPNVAACYRLIRAMDKPPVRVGQQVFRAIPLQHARAEEVDAVLSSLFAGKAQRPAARGAPPPPAAPSIEADVRTNKILVRGTAEEVDQITDAIKALDEKMPSPETRAHLIRLSHMHSREAAQALVQTIASSPTLWRDPADRRTGPMVVAVDRINAVIVTAQDHVVEKVRELISQLDEAVREDVERAKAAEKEKPSSGR